MPWSELLDLVWPTACAACDEVMETAAPFCATCAVALEPVPEPCCRLCAQPSEHPGRCGRCRGRPSTLSATFAAFVHEGPIARAIHRFKYEDHPELADPLGTLLARTAGGFLRAEEVVVPVPLHAARLRTRRYDQVQLLAGVLGNRAGLPVFRSGLTRVRRTARQVGLDEPGRERNVAGAFSASERVRGVRILLLDDVVTTGATARSAARALRRVGARSVRAAMLARAP